MKTAEERLAEYGITDKTRHHNYDYLFKSMVAALTLHAREACGEQRHICQIERDKDSVQMKGKFYVSCKDVLNSPEPELK